MQHAQHPIPAVGAVGDEGSYHARIGPVFLGESRDRGEIAFEVASRKTEAWGEIGMGANPPVKLECRRDLRFALRGLLRTPGFTAAAVLALALGIGATTAIFSVVHAVLLRSLGWGEESRLVSVRGNFYSQNLLEIWISPQEYKDLRSSPLFEIVVSDGSDDGATW